MTFSEARAKLQEALDEIHALGEYVPISAIDDDARIEYYLRELESAIMKAKFGIDAIQSIYRSTYSDSVFANPPRFPTKPAAQPLSDLA